jgi:hypothetical protein
MTALIVLIFIAALAYSYIKLRPWLSVRLPGVYAKLDSIEAVLWQRSRTLLATRLTGLASIVIGINDALAAAGADVTPIINTVFARVPDDFRPLIITVFGVGVAWLFGRLRKLTAPVPDEPIEPVAP